MKTLFGWAGRILKVDLTERKTSISETVDYVDRFLGGIGIGEKIYWDSSSPALEAFHADNPLIIMTGPLAATPAPSASRMVVCGKSPATYPETFVRSCVGGFFPAELKKAGYDGIVIEGKADKPAYLSIANEKVEIRDASHLWGLTNSNARDIIKEELGGNPRILSIGPGAEHGSRLGIILGDIASSGSMGFGSVMGSRNLKAIAVRGSGTIPVADPERTRLIRDRFRAMVGEGYFNLFGWPRTIFGEIVKRIHCHGCPQGCWRTLRRSPAGEEGIRKCQTGPFYTNWDKKLHGHLTEASFHATTLANEYSVCIVELGTLFTWLDRCFQQGILSEKEAELPLSKIGSREFLETMIRKISFKEGFGEVLAEGALRASKILGKESEEITSNFLTQTGRGIAYGPKIFIPASLIYATEPRPSITELHEVCGPLTKWAVWHLSKGEESYVSTDVLRKIAEKFFGSGKAVDYSTYEGKAAATVRIQDRQTAKDSLILCDFAWPVHDDASTEEHVGDPTLESQLFTAVTGRETDETELYRTAERIFTLNRAILLREGRKGRQDDYLPEFQFIEEKELSSAGIFGAYNPELLLPAEGDEVISRKGKAVDREKFEQMLEEYYQLRGWDPQTGLLRKDTLIRLDLEDVIEPLQEKVV